MHFSHCVFFLIVMICFFCDVALKKWFLVEKAWLPTLLSSDFVVCINQGSLWLFHFQEFGHQPPDWLKEIASSSGIE